MVGHACFMEVLPDSDSKSSSEHMSECDLLVGLRDEIVDTMLRIEEVNSQVKHHMVPLSLTQSIRTLTQQDKVSNTCYTVYIPNRLFGSSVNQKLRLLSTSS